MRPGGCLPPDGLLGELLAGWLAALDMFSGEKSQMFIGVIVC